VHASIFLINRENGPHKIVTSIIYKYIKMVVCHDPIGYTLGYKDVLILIIPKKKNNLFI
jgi:hypothetical protein